jgi:hypothetical protein
MGAVVTGLKPQSLSGFKGMYARGLSETCPPDHLQICDNCAFPGDNQVDVREFFSQFVALPGGRQIISFFFGRTAVGPALLTLDNAGHLRDETNFPASILHTFGTVDDIAAINIFGRVYLSPKYQGRAVTSEFVYYYDASSATIVQAAGIAPVTGPTVANAGGGNVSTPGTHGVAVSFLYKTGYLSPPGPTTFFNSNGTGLSLTVIPTGGANVVGRVILMTLANQLTLFFVPGGTINDNVTLTFTINVVDSQLIASADYLNRVLTTIPACSALKFYSGRMAYIGGWQFPDQLLMSQVQLPENIDNVQGVVNMPVDYGINNCNGGMIINRTLYVTKPAGTWAVQDNGLVPNNWPVDPIDTGLGAFDTGISSFSSAFSGSDILDLSLIANSRGLMLFNGQYTDRPLSWKIETVWQTIPSNYMYRVQIAHQVFTKRVYIVVPLSLRTTPGGRPIATTDPNGLPGILLMMDYQAGLDPINVKWSVWWYGTVPWIFRAQMVNNAQAYAGAVPANLELIIATGGNTLLGVNDGQVAFADSGPVSIYQTLMLAPVESDEDISTFVMLNFDISGVGLMSINLTNKRGNTSSLVSYTGFNLSAYTAGQNLQRLINYTNEGMSVLLSCDQSIPGGLNGRIILTAVDVYGKPMWKMRPALVETS